MRLLFCGDLVGRSGRTAAIEMLPGLRRELALDFVVVNGENAAGGFGITEQICNQLYAAGADVITTGNHIWDQKETVAFIDRHPRLLRPDNFPPGTPGRGCGFFEAPDGRRIVVINLMGRLFMDPLGDPFANAVQRLAEYRLTETADAILVDFHAEATSEKTALGHFLDGKVSVVVGTHTHVPTADARVLPGGTAYMTDAGMCGDYDSVIGMHKAVPIARFTTKLPTERMVPANGPATLCGLFVETDDQTGLASRAVPFRRGGVLAEQGPDTKY
ncbi:MAG: 2,3-cyclic-nucleotide 2-phosphodiesterase [Rhodospirillaceae bacterium]|jgi:metallophosphoesterase (TIGR00282 family)|nr:2,3-cyclic-nucleotide 2-phosphodiesterase [Rhodospirillaceae bacterium]